jgi:gliding motility-associated-like protein
MGFSKILSRFVNVSLIFVFNVTVFAQSEIYDDCANALELCPNSLVNVNNIGATKLQFPNSADVFPPSFCFTANNTIWLKFNTNELGGFVQINLSNLVFQTETSQGTEIQATMLEATIPCDASTYTPVGNCQSGTTANFILSANLLPLKTYYVVLNGSSSGAGITKAAEFSADVVLNGVGVIRAVPAISIVSDKDTICRDELITFSTELFNCPDSGLYNWYINDVLVAKTIDTFFRTSAFRKGDLIKVTNSCYTNCIEYPENSLNNIEVIEFLVDAGPDQQIAYGETTMLTGITSVTSFIWSPNDAIAGIKTLNPKVNPVETQTYFLTGDSLGCSFSDAVTIKVGYKLEITNSFTPNNDGSNDTWMIPGLVNYPNCLVEIYDRWGQLVFTATGYNDEKAWDGKKNGKALNESTYYYVIHWRDNDDNVSRGTVTIIR